MLCFQKYQLVLFGSSIESNLDGGFRKRRSSVLQFIASMVRLVILPTMVNQTGVFDWLTATTPTGWATAAVSATEKL